MKRFPKRSEDRYPTPKNDPMVVAFPGQEPEEPKQGKISKLHAWGPSLVSAPLGVLLGWALTNIDKLKQHSFISKSVLVAALIIVLAFVIRFAWRWLQGLVDARAESQADAEFVATKEEELRDLLSTFRPFVANHDIHSLRNILRSSLAEDRETLGQILGCEYAENWAHFLDLQLKEPSRTEQIFSNRAAEFASLVNHFIRIELQPAQKAIEASKQPYSDSFLDALEQLREDFNDFIRELQKWSVSVNEHLRSKLGYHTPNQSFERISPFRRNKAVGVAANNVTVNGK